MEETLKDIARTLQDYGTILRHIDGRIEAMEVTIEMIRQSQMSITQRENQLEQECRQRHDAINEMLKNLNKRVAAIESRLTPLPHLVPVEEG